MGVMRDPDSVRIRRHTNMADWIISTPPLLDREAEELRQGMQIMSQRYFPNLMFVSSPHR
jgi:hypothetical protein